MRALKWVFPFVLAMSFGFALNGTSNAAGFDDTTDRQPVACHSDGAKEIVLLTFGQSVSANYGEAAYKPHGNAINFNPNDGHCYATTDPLLGADAGRGDHVGSIWGYLCDKLLAARQWDRCIIAPTAQGDSSMADWAPGGRVHQLVRKTVDGLSANGLVPSAMLYGQGESDASVHADPVSYQAKFNEMVADIRSFSTAPILIAVETICYSQSFDLTDTDDATRIAKWIGQEKIAQAQRAVVDPSRGIFPGPYLDYINGREGRWDGCHLSTYGLKAAASQWMYYVLQAVPEPALPSSASAIRP
jgi:hypothetical protein